MSKTKFTKDERNATLTVERVFHAPRARVWRALTDPTILDQWWAPRPWKTETVAMDFRVGGHWHYAMNGPDGEQHFGRMDYIEIEPDHRYKANDVFADAAGATNTNFPAQVFTTTLLEAGGTTTVLVTVSYASLEDMKTVLEMGMEEGLATAQDQLEALLAQGEAM